MPLDAFAELQSYQQPSSEIPQTGMALTGQQPAIMPPQSPADFQSRTAGWMSTFNEMLSNPTASMMLLQAGLSLTNGATGGEAVGDAFGMLGKSQGLMEKQQQQGFSNQIAQERLGLDREELDLRRQLQQAQLARIRQGGGGGGGGAGKPGKNFTVEQLVAMGYPPSVAQQMVLQQSTKTGDFATKDPRLGQATMLEKQIEMLQGSAELERDPERRKALQAQVDGLRTQWMDITTEIGQTPHGPKMPGYYQPEATSADQQRRLAELNPAVWGAGKSRVAGPVQPEAAGPTTESQTQMPATGRARFGPERMTTDGPIQQKNGRWDIGARTPEVRDRIFRGVLEVARPGEAVWDGDQFLFNLTPDMIAALRKKYGINPGGQR